MSETVAMLRAGENFVVLAGMVNIPASLTWGQDFAVPFASVAADPNGAGPSSSRSTEALVRARSAPPS